MPQYLRPTYTDHGKKVIAYKGSKESYFDTIQEAIDSLV